MGRKVGHSLRTLRWPLAALALLATFLFAAWLRQTNFSSQFLVYSYLQIVGTLLSFTYAANAFVHFRGTQDRLTLILALGFVFAGVIETFGMFGLYAELIAGTDQGHVAMSWMVGRTLLGLLLLSALLVERRVPHSREPAREIAIAFIVVGVVAYLTAAAYLGAPIQPAIHSSALLARPWDLLPALLFLAAAIGFRSRRNIGRSPFDCALYAALWMNVACHIAATQSSHTFDAPFTLAEILKVASYAVVLGGTLLDNARLFEQVRRLAVSDSLTGLGNYRTLLNILEGEIQRSQRSGRPFALLLMDLDGLKQINDRHGHLVGSRAICRLGNVLRVHCRSIDTAARYGGDEFALVLPEAAAGAAERVGQRIRERLVLDGEMPHITVSVGASVFPRDGQSIDELLDSADRALYKMKRRGSRAVSLARVAACL